MKKLFINNINDLNELQRVSFYNFLFNTIHLELKKFPNSFKTKILLNNKSKVVLFLINLDYKNLNFNGPEFTMFECIVNKKTYSVKLYISATYSYFIKLRNKDYRKKYTIKKNILLGEIPLMTEEGTFIIDGYERVIISQIIKSPGVFFKKEISNTNQKSYVATVISNKGAWTKFILDEKIIDKKNNIFKDRIYMQLDNISSFKSFLKDKKSDIIQDNNKIFILDLINFLNLKPKYIKDNDYLNNINLNNLNLQLYKDLENKEFNSNDTNFNFDIFSVGQIGRYKINKSLNLNIPKDIDFLVYEDFLSIIKGLLDLKYGIRNEDDIDHLKNKQIRSIGELLSNQIRLALYNVKANLNLISYNNKNKINNKLKNFVLKKFNSNSNILNSDILTNVIKDFFKTSELSQFMDQINPLSEQAHKSKITVFGPNSLNSDNISTKIRDIHPSEYGRFCSIETPEGQSSGLVSSITLLSRISSLGWLETPYFLINKKYIHNNKKPVFLNPEQESRLDIAFSDIFLNKENTLDNEYTLTKKNYSFINKNSNKVNFITTTPAQIMSLSTSLIPFMEHNDANRALMGTSMQKQAVPLIYTQKPLIGTNMESNAILDSNMIIKSYSEGKVKYSSSSLIKIEDKSGQEIYYYLQKYNKSNQNTSIIQKPIVWNNEVVYSGQIIADGSSTNDGELSLGRNLTIAYMPWEGYNYEDAILINERLIFDNIFTSVVIEEVETVFKFSSEYDSSEEILSKNIPNMSKHLSSKLDNNGIIKIGSYVKDNDILVGKLSINKKLSYSSKLIKLINNIKEDNIDIDFEDTSLYTPKGIEGKVIDIRVLNQDNEDLILSDKKYTVIKIYIAVIKKIGVGDKLSGRHGNKGVISKILSENDMPFLPDGTRVDIVLNPLGVPSRMNVGQIFECLFGLASEKIGKRFKINPFDEIYGEEASRILINQKLKEAAIKSNNKWLFNSNFPGKILLRDGRTGEYFDNPVTV